MQQNREQNKPGLTRRDHLSHLVGVSCTSAVTGAHTLADVIKAGGHRQLQRQDDTVGEALKIGAIPALQS